MFAAQAQIFSNMSDAGTGPGSSAGSHYTTRGHTRKRHHIHRRLWLCVSISESVWCDFCLTICTAGPEDKSHLDAEIRKAHVICIVYSIDNPGSFDRIPAYWLPLFRQLGVNVRCCPYTALSNHIQY